MREGKSFQKLSWENWISIKKKKKESWSIIYTTHKKSITALNEKSQNYKAPRRKYRRIFLWLTVGKNFLNWIQKALIIKEMINWTPSKLKTVLKEHHQKSENGRKYKEPPPRMYKELLQLNNEKEE